MHYSHILCINYTCIEIVKICETCEIIRFPINYNFPLFSYTRVEFEINNDI